MLTRFDQLLTAVWLLWNRFMIAWYESEVRRLDAAIAKQQRIIDRYS
jgi:hypothetical protein